MHHIRQAVPQQQQQRSCWQAQSGSAYSMLPPTSIPWRVFWAKDDGIPQHDVVRVGRAIDTLGWILSQALEVAHEALQTAKEVQQQ